MQKRNYNIFYALFPVLFIALMILSPQICSKGALYGLMLSSKIIIPSLYPFTVCVLILMKLNISGCFNFLNKFSFYLFRLNIKEFFVYIFSLIGGYPVGAKLIDSLAAEEDTEKNKSGNMLCFCVNAGPGFIVTAVGCGILNSRSAGYYLLISHISASFILMLLSRKSLSESSITKSNSKAPIPFSEIFVSAAADSASAMINICSFTVLFSTLASYLAQYNKFKKLLMILEITNGVTQTRNIYIISFLLGFAGFSVWMQIISLSKFYKINLLKFVLFRIMHGTVSSILLFFMMKFAPIKIPVFSCSRNHSFKIFYSDAALAISLFIMTVLFIISTFDIKHSRKRIKDML